MFTEQGPFIFCTLRQQLVHEVVERTAGEHGSTIGLPRQVVWGGRGGDRRSKNALGPAGVGWILIAYMESVLVVMEVVDEMARVGTISSASAPRDLLVGGEWRVKAREGSIV